jgi:ABC-type nitrate/sulfonate/bicarbonate transport system substrate-binding protein
MKTGLRGIFGRNIAFGLMGLAILAAPRVALAEDVSLALNYTLGASHGGLVAADQLGYFKDAGLTVKILPWSSQTRSETLVAAGKTDFAFVASSDDALINFAADRPVKVVMTVTQHDPAIIGVRADSPITRPAQLDGKTYGGFGSAKEPLLLQSLIQADGGKGDVKVVTLGTAAYDAVYKGDVDAALFWDYSDAVQAEMVGRALRYFRFHDFGLPDQYGDLIMVNSDYLAGHEETTKKLLAALVKGYAYELAHPKEVAEMLVKADPSADLAFTTKSVEAFNKTLAAADGSIGTMDINVWKTRGDYWIDHGFLVDEAGEKLTKTIDYTKYVTNAYLPAK